MLYRSYLVSKGTVGIIIRMFVAITMTIGQDPLKKIFLKIVNLLKEVVIGKIQPRITLFSFLHKDLIIYSIHTL